MRILRWFVNCLSQCNSLTLMIMRVVMFNCWMKQVTLTLSQRRKDVLFCSTLVLNTEFESHEGTRKLSLDGLLDHVGSEVEHGRMYDKLDIMLQERRNSGTAWTRNEKFDRDGYLVVKTLNPEELYHPVPPEKVSITIGTKILNTLIMFQWRIKLRIDSVIGIHNIALFTLVSV